MAEGEAAEREVWVRLAEPGTLLPAVVQDAVSGEVLMVAWVSGEALARTLRDRQAWFHSRSRGSLWRKGEKSGHTMEVTEVRYDCDADAILYRVLAKGPACHTGRRSCFYRSLSLPETWPPAGPVDGGSATASAAGPVGAAVAATADEAGRSAPTPGEAAGAGPVSPVSATEAPTGGTGAEVLAELEDVVRERRRSPRPDSYTSRLLAEGRRKVAQRLGEEAVEAALAGAGEDDRRVVEELADLVYHATVLLAERDLSWRRVWEELAARRRPG